MYILLQKPNRYLIMKPLLSLLLLFLAAISLSCSEMPADWQDMNIEDIAREIDKEVGDAPANRVSECKIIPIGVKPCGGPRGFLVFSSKHSDEEKLSALAGIYDELDEKRNSEENLISTCEVASAPPLELKNGKCNGTTQNAWNPGDILKLNNIN